MRKSITLLIMSSIWVMNLYAQNTATLGTGTSNGTYQCPIFRPQAAHGNGDRSMMYFVFAADELSAAGIRNGDTIKKLAWYKNNSGATTGDSAMFQIYLKNSSLTELQLGSQWGAITPSMTMCYENLNQHISAATGWVTFTLNTPFIYTGGAIEIANNWDCMKIPGNPTTGTFTWRYTTYTTKKALGNAGDGIFSVLGSWTYMTDTWGGTRRANLQITYSPGPVCTGTPDPGLTIASVSAACSGKSFALWLQNPTGSGSTYQWQSSTTGSDPWTNLGTNSAISVSQTVEKYYRCQVTCGSNTGISIPVKVALNPFYNCYCNSGAVTPDQSDIGNVTIGTLNNSSDSGTVARGPGSIKNKYSNYCNFVTIPDLQRNVTYPFSVSVIDWGYPGYTGMFKIFFDYNRDLDFDDAGESVYSSLPDGGTVVPYTQTGNITIPATATTGQTVMRVKDVDMSYSAAALTPCIQHAWGEVEDYLVNIIDAPAVVTSAATGVTTGSATIKGTVNANGSQANASFDWGLTTDYGNQVDATPAVVTGASITTIVAPLAGLLPGTTYHYRAKGVNGVGTANGSDMTFTTLTPLTAVNGNVTDVSGCNGNSNGAITTSLTGGVSPFSYLWSNGATTASLSAIGAGNYSVTVTDATSTAVTGNWTVSQPSEILLTAQVSATNCPESNNGAIDLTATGGTPANTFLWSNGATTEDLTGLDAGDYTVTVTDANGCLKTGTWTVAQTSPVCDSISVAGTVTTTVCYNATNTITVAGGATPFIVEAPNGNATFIAGQRIFFLPGTAVDSGAYLLAYISNSYCTNPTMPLVAQEEGKADPPSIMSFGKMKIYPNPTTGSFTLEFTDHNLLDNLSAFICDIRGKKILDINLNGQRKQVLSLENQPKGMYFIRLFSNEKSETAKILKQ